MKMVLQKHIDVSTNYFFLTISDLIFAGATLGLGPGSS
jgi:hypothetical protein